MADDYREAREGLAPLLEAGLAEMVVVDGVEKFKITAAGRLVAEKMMGCEPGELDGIKRSKPYMDDTPEPEGAP
mgnify:CR=1 FL=1|tara:strand:- start:43 stop:264 length:222 start_codon:yes stop_codon:yes gene_type:complete